MNEDLRKWFSQKWVRMDTKGNIKGDCAREPGEGKPKCLPLAKASSMDKEDRAAAARRKRREDPVADRPGKGGKPVNVATEEVSTSELIKKSHSKRGAPGTLKAKIQGPLTLAKVRSLKNKTGATTLDKKQANFYINMHSEEYLEEKNVPTNPSLWARAKSLARSKFDVYPSAYANGWAAKWYKGKGGGWKSVQEGKQMKSLKDILSEGVAVSSDFKLVNTVNAQGKPVTRKVRAHRKTISPQSEDKSDVLTSIQNFVGRQYSEEVEQIDEIHGAYIAALAAMPAAAYVGAKLGNKISDYQDKKRKEKAKADLAAVKARRDAKKMKKEEVEQIDELSKSTLGSYVKKATKDAKLKHGMGKDFEHLSSRLKKPEYKQGAKDWEDKYKSDARKREAGVGKAVDRLTKEEVEQIDEYGNTPKGQKMLAKVQKRATDRLIKADDKNRLEPDVSKRDLKTVKKNAATAQRAWDRMEEEVELDEVDSKTLASFLKKNPGYKVDTRSTKERIAASKEKSANQMKRGEPTKMAPASKADVDKQIAKSYSQHKPGQYVGDSVELEGTPIVEAKKSAAVRWQEALQKAKQKREEEEARKAANEKRALEPKKQGVAEGSDDIEDTRQWRDAIALAKSQKAIRQAQYGKDQKFYADGTPVTPEEVARRAAERKAKKKGVAEAEKKPHPKTWHDVDKKLGKAVDKMSQAEKVKKGFAHPNTLKKKGVAEAKDPREYDYEGDMAKTQLRSIIANSQAVHDMLKDTTNLAEWVQSKITKAEDYISTVADYMTAEVNEAKQEDDEEDYSKHHKLDPDSGVEADQHIHVQLKKAIDSTMKPYEVTFKNGKKHSVSSPVAKTIVTAIEKLKPEHRKAVHDELHKSYDSLMGVHKMITGK